MIERFVGLQMHTVACNQMTRWAKDPKVTPGMLRRALDAVLADYAATGPLSDNLKVEYLTFLKTYDDRDLVWKSLNDPDTVGPGKAAWFARDQQVFSIAKGLKHEPERSRRVARLVFANLLAVVDLPPARRPPVACTLRGSFAGAPPALVDLYSLDESAPAPARALSPEEVRRWFRTRRSTPRTSCPPSSPSSRPPIASGVTQANLVLALANRLFEIERGQPPETFEALVGPYLKVLPEGYQPLQ